MKNVTVLGGMSPASFMRDYWHKKPLLIRQAIPQFSPALTRDALFALASRDDVESRLITHFNGRWRLKQGPFDKLPSVRKTSWTLLVQGVNLHDDAADRLLQRFRFIPDARLDDLMISFASDGGGVGPHFDSYDVFLLQAHGKRRWRIGPQKELDLVEGLPLKILRDFKPGQEFVLEPGDMLYLPPHYAHDGTAIGECMTYSIGFRAPSYQELGESFLQFLAEQVELPGRYADPGLRPTSTPARLDAGLIKDVAHALRRIRFSDEDVAVFLGEYLSEPKSSVFFDRPARQPAYRRFILRAERNGIALSSKTKMLYAGSNLFCNGTSYRTTQDDRVSLKRLADARRLTGEDVAAASHNVRQALYEWYENGWLGFAPA